MTRSAPTAPAKSLGKRRVRIVLASITIAPLLLAGAIAIAVSVAGQNLPIADELIATVVLFGVASAGILACVWAWQVTRPKGFHKLLLIAGIALPALGWICLSISLWTWDTPETPMGRAGVIGFFTGGVIAFGALASMFRVRSWALWLRHAAVLGVAGCALVMSLSIMHGGMGPWYVRVFGTCLSIALLSSILVCLLAAIFPSMRIGRDEVRPGDKTVPFTCPVCATHQVIIVGRHLTCRACALGFNLTLDAPRCECGYDLMNLTGSICPECGTQVPRRHSWALATAGTPPAHPSV